jgi:hypothetical protein
MTRHKKTWWDQAQTLYLRHLIERELFNCRQAAAHINEIFGTSFTRSAVVARAWRLGIKAKASVLRLFCPV